MISEQFIQGTYFNHHPEKVIGEETMASGRFGPTLKVVGTMDQVVAYFGDCEMWDPYAFRPGAKKPVEKDKPKPVRSKVKQAIQKTKNSKPVVLDGSFELLDFDDVIAKYNPGITEDEIKAWTYYQKGRLFDPSVISKPGNGWAKYLISASEFEKVKSSWLKKGILAYDGKEYLPEVVYYSGNMYKRIADAKARKAEIVREIGESSYNDQLAKLESNLPKKLTLDGPFSERLYISPVDSFAREFKVRKLADGTDFFGEERLIDAFAYWIKELSPDDFTNGSNAGDVLNHYIEKSKYPYGTDEKEKAARDRKAQADGQRLFQIFIGEKLLAEDQRKIEHIWNTTYNNWKDYDYSKVPFGCQLNTKFKNFDLEVRPAQREGVAFQSITGSGIIAYDVGVGKTMTAIVAVGQALYTGQAKRPLVVVPAPTYDKWIAEFRGEYDKKGNLIKHGVLPQYGIKDYFNLGVNYVHKAQNDPPKDGEITVISYEALANIGFGRELEQELSDEMFQILSQGGLEARDSEKLREQVDGLIGAGNLNTSVLMEEMGWDMIVIDEAHNMKNIFIKVAGEVERDVGTGEKSRAKSKYKIQGASKPADRAIKAFLLSQYIQKNNQQGNVLLLTATPFTNSPLEIYSMLSLVGYKGLKERGINNLSHFFDKFVNETSELTVTTSNKLKMQTVIKSFNNRIVLQSIIFHYINYKSGEEANIKRPVKIVYPYVKGEDGLTLPAEEQVLSSLQPSPLQSYWIREICRFANKSESEITQYVPKEPDGTIAGEVLRGMAYSRQMTLSPYLLSVGGKANSTNPADVDLPPLTYKSYIETSPKLEYCMECIRTVKKHHEDRGEDVSGQVIYMDAGTDYFDLVKEYLVKEIGYDTKEVEILKGGVSVAKKEKIKKGFLSGAVKILIGSSTIKEGIDLQDRATTLYNLTLDWNPTDIKQLEGRIWRFGNRHSHVRIVNVLLENSMDVFMFQKLEEKTARINDIWFREGRGNVLDLDAVDPAELKLALITDPEEKAKQDINMKVEKLELELAVARSYAESLKEARSEIASYSSLKEKIEGYHSKALQWMPGELAKALTDYESKKQSYDEKVTGVTKRDVEQAERYYQRLEAMSKADQSDLKVRIRTIKFHNNNGPSWARSWGLDYELDRFVKTVRNIERIEKNVLAKEGLTIEDDFSHLSEKYEAQAKEITLEIEELKSADNLVRLVEEYTREQAKRDNGAKSVAERVKEFTRHNHLLSCLDKVHACSPSDPKIIPIGDRKEEPKPEGDKQKKIKLARAKAKAQAQRIRILKLKNVA